MTTIKNISSDALKHLQKDPIMATLIDTYDLPGWNTGVNLFLELVSSIIGQQLSVKAGNTIEKRFFALFDTPSPSAGEILEKDDEVLRGVGISYGKIKYIKGISQAVIDGFDFEVLKNLPDEEVIERLIVHKGIGRWTAEMFLMFSLNREDVFSLGDLGLRNAVANLYGVDRTDLKTIEQVSLQWKPYRSLASRYLWKSLDNTPKT